MLNSTVCSLPSGAASPGISSAPHPTGNGGGLVDECTSDLDAQTEAVVLNNIWPLLDGKTVIIITHRLSAIDGLVDEVVAFAGGQVARRVPGGDLGMFADQLHVQPVG